MKYSFFKYFIQEMLVADLDPRSLRSSCHDPTFWNIRYSATFRVPFLVARGVDWGVDRSRWKSRANERKTEGEKKETYRMEEVAEKGSRVIFPGAMYFVYIHTVKNAFWRSCCKEKNGIRITIYFNPRRTAFPATKDYQISFHRSLMFFLAV